MKIIILLLCSLQLHANDLVAAAKERLNHWVVYDGAYQKIDYPNGDVDQTKGVCTDVIIRSYRALGVDLQQLVHEDMRQHFTLYPKIWGLTKPDSNIDHRRVPNLETFFARFGTVLSISDQGDDYQPGDLVSWRLTGSGLPHIGIVSDQKAASGNYKIIHNIGFGPQINDMLFAHPIKGHFRFAANTD
ncbi:DUF1287 domain-containing protein [Marinicella litoralis]|uniref:DUF1287 domain-containing protein n=1 Tax=Marinicella litoralis TaxID=644220 RepID=A0A4R6Y0H2_9GAMM|nr:DUF1287 domain-containing protein [Marinicella litoralis]TDR23613.1 hypothetical protein C8D91_0477 [Marinicella litoralis]